MSSGEPFCGEALWVGIMVLKIASETVLVLPRAVIAQVYSPGNEVWLSGVV